MKKTPRQSGNVEDRRMDTSWFAPHRNPETFNPIPNASYPSKWKYIEDQRNAEFENGISSSQALPPESPFSKMLRDMNTMKFKHDPNARIPIPTPRPETMNMNSSGIAALQQAAAQGRYGDDSLLHVSKQELAGLQALAGGKLTTNPKTGLPEAFFFLPFLSALFGGGAAAAAPAALAATGTAAGAGALSSGLATGLAAAGSALPTAAASALPAAASAALPAGIDALTTGAIPAAATTAATPALTVGAAPVIGGATHAAVNAAPLIVGGGAAAPASGLAALTSPAASTAGVSSLTPAAAAGPVSSIASPGAVAAKTGAGAMMAPAPATASGIQGIQAAGAGAAGDSASGIGGLFGKGIAGLGKMDPLTMMMLGQGISGMFGSKGDKGGDDGGKTDVSGDDYYKKGGKDPTFPGSGYKPGKDPEWKYFAGGGLVKGYADGGIASLNNTPPGANMLQGMPQSTMPPQQMPGQPMQAGMSPDPNQIPQSPYPKKQIGSQTDGEKELIAQTVAAIKGRHPNPQGIIMAFVQQFGEQALQDLVARVKGGGSGPPQQAGISDGTSDSIPAMLSEGEYVVPADVVSKMGNGSTDAGAKRLDQMTSGVRGYAGGGLVAPMGATGPVVAPTLGAGMSRGPVTVQPTPLNFGPAYTPPAYAPGTLPSQVAAPRNQFYGGNNQVMMSRHSGDIYQNGTNSQNNQPYWGGHAGR